jgi:hypothetical protein
MGSENLKWCTYCAANVDTLDDPDHFQTNGKCVYAFHGDKWESSYLDLKHLVVCDIPQVRCVHCGLKLEPDGKGIRQMGSGYDSCDWYCSWDCVLEQESNRDRWADTQCKRDREDPLRKYQYNNQTGRDKRR